MASESTPLIYGIDGTIGQTKRKPGRPKMAPYGNTSRKSQKSIYLSKDCQEMLKQVKIVLGVNESDFSETAIRKLYMQERREYIATFGESAWDAALSRSSSRDGLKDVRSTLVK